MSIVKATETCYGIKFAIKFSESVINPCFPPYHNKIIQIENGLLALQIEAKSFVRP